MMFVNNGISFEKKQAVVVVKVWEKLKGSWCVMVHFAGDFGTEVSV
jgi:hypothetical protein